MPEWRVKVEQKEYEEVLAERCQLAVERIREIGGEDLLQPEFGDYFKRTAEFLLLLEETRQFLKSGKAKQASLKELQKRNKSLYEDILPENYEKSYGNPAFAVEKLGEYGQGLSWLYVQMRAGIGAVYEGKTEEYVIRLELFTEVYAAFSYEWQENQKLPKKEEIRETMYWFVSDYADIFAESLIREQLCPGEGLAVELIEQADLSNPSYLYSYGLYVSENEVKTAEYLAALPEETIHVMADTYTEGYRMGFELAGIDLNQKTTVDLVYHIGFERMMRRAVENFEKLGLKPSVSCFAGERCESSSPNRQFTYDHKDDLALFLDKKLVNRKLEARRAAFENYKEQALGYAGPAVLETFGEAQFQPVNKPEAVSMTEEQNRLYLELRSQLQAVSREYINYEERSFTIIAFPIPEAGPVFEELFAETIRLNTLDYMLYRDVQQKMIDVLDTADYCEVKGCGENRTDLRVNLWKLKNPEKETIFENCVADVNIPVGEVFTTPVLEGTNGLLHVTRVYLEGLEYKNLAITFKEGMIADYTCTNFETEEENRNFIKENVLFRQETLPMGEFAIGTNTTAYAAARRLGVEEKLPILIAEKTGPHFAVGDTCYSHSEELPVHNPDGKEIVAKDNSRSLLRTTNPGEAYFNCHTDITIPYDELGELTAVKKDGTRIPIILNGRFVLPGTEVLNEPLQIMAE